MKSISLPEGTQKSNMKSINGLKRLDLNSKNEKNRPRDKDTKNLNLFNYKKRNPQQ